jgi:Acetyltransferase (GNAT) domain
MVKARINTNRIIDNLGGGLILRRATLEDIDELVAFNAQIHGDDEQDVERVAAWTRDLMEKPHPTFDIGDFTIIEETATGKIVSSLNLISQTWNYSGIKFGVGRPELVGTLPEYRNRGLVRAQFEVVHQWSAGRGELMQAITGIPYYYRQFGYEMGLNLGGGRTGFKSNVPLLKEGEQELYLIRPASEFDIEFIAQLYHFACHRYLVNCVRDENLWRYELNGKSSKNVNRMELCVIETSGGERVGFLAHPFNVWGTAMVAMAYEVMPGTSWSAVTPTVERYLFSTGQTYAARDNKQDRYDSFGFYLGDEHPVYQVLRNNLPNVQNPYSWYVRLPDLPEFLRHITPVLERRLSSSLLAGHSGVLMLTFYRTGLRMVFEKGKLTTVDPWKPDPQAHSGDAAFPDLTFLQLMLGYRSLDELKYAFADCWYASDEIYALLNSLFPKQSSDIWAIS